MNNKQTVIIGISGGVAELVEAPPEISVSIHDYDVECYEENDVMLAVDEDGTEYREIVLADGRKTTMRDNMKHLGIVDEQCTCGHRKSQHGPGSLGVAEGHGICLACSCEKFTWESFIHEDHTEKPT